MARALRVRRSASTLQSRNAREVARVASRRYSQPKGEGGRADQRSWAPIVTPRPLRRAQTSAWMRATASVIGMGSNPAMMCSTNACRRTPGAPCAVHAVQKLAHGDHADRALLIAEERLQGIGATSFPVDEEIGVDQDGQGLSGAPSARMRRRSAANSSSIGGAELSSERNASSESRPRRSREQRDGRAVPDDLDLLTRRHAVQDVGEVPCGFGCREPRHESSVSDKSDYRSTREAALARSAYSSAFGRFPVCAW